MLFCNIKKSASEIAIFCDKAIEYLLYSVVFFVPILFCPLTYSSFELPKITFIRLLTLVMILFVVLKVIFTKEIAIKKTIIDIPVLFFLFSVFLSTIFSTNKLNSIFGYYGFFEGLFTALNYILIYFIFTRTIKTKKQINTVVSLIISSGVIVATYGLFQYFGFEIVASWKETTAQRIISSLGSPMLLGSFLCVIIPFVVFRIFTRDGYIKILYFILFSVVFSCMLLTFTRGAYLAFVLSMFVIFLNRKLFIFKKEIAIISTIVVFLFIIFCKEKIIISNEEITLAQRSNPFTIFKSQSVKIRSEIWKDGLKIIAKRPVTGWGLDSFSDAYNVIGSKKLPSLTGLSLASPEKAHNEVLQISSTVGLFGLFSYLFVIICFFVLLINLISKDKSYFSVAILSSFVAYFIQAQSSYNTSSVALYFWCMIGLGVSCWEIQNQTSYGKIVKLDFGKAGIIFYSLLFAITLFAVKVVISQFLADIHFAKGMDFSQKEKANKAILEFKRALALNPLQEIYYNSLGITYAKNGEDELAIVEFENVLKLNPSNSLAYNNMGISYMNISKLKKAISLFEKAKKISPNVADIRFNLADALLKDNKIDAAIQEYEEGIKIFSQDKYAYLSLGRLYYKKGNFKKAKLCFTKSIEIDKNFAPAYNDLGLSLIKLNELDKAEENLKFALSLAPDCGECYVNLGLVYYKKNMLNEAEDAIKEALKILPDNETANYALSQIEKSKKKDK